MHGFLKITDTIVEEDGSVNNNPRGLKGMSTQTGHIGWFSVIDLDWVGAPAAFGAKAPKGHSVRITLDEDYVVPDSAGNDGWDHVYDFAILDVMTDAGKLDHQVRFHRVKIIAVDTRPGPDKTFHVAFVNGVIPTQHIRVYMNFGQMQQMSPIKSDSGKKMFFHHK